MTNFTYLAYNEYVDWGGELDLQTFMGYNYLAQSTIDYYTFNRLHKIDFCELDNRTQMAIKQCSMRLIELLKLKDSAIGVSNEATNTVNHIVSQSNDGVSTTYSTMPTEEAIVHIEENIRNTINIILGACKLPDGRNLLYRGIYPDD